MILRSILNKHQKCKYVFESYIKFYYHTSYTVIKAKYTFPKSMWIGTNLCKTYSFYKSKLYDYLSLRTFNTSVVLLKRRKTKEERAHANIIQFKPKTKLATIEVWNGITPKEFAKQANRSVNAVFEALTYIENGHLYRHANVEIHNNNVMIELAKVLGFRVQKVKNPHEANVEKVEVIDLIKRPKPDPKDLVKRPPVVTIMGHVDHGKTTLLDSLRNTSVAAQEHGGITQHIGAFTIKMPNGVITFLDTPGHAAFQAMRSRGAHATDIVVLVVAADDGVMEQTLESVRFAKEAKVPIIVAINKIDKPQADPERAKQELLSCGLQLEELGGDIQGICISALKKLHLNDLMEAILLQAEIMGIGGDPTGPVEGIILETSVHKFKGKISTALIQRGTLQKGNILVAGTSWAKVKGLLDDQGKAVTEAGPGIPVQVLGWKSLPNAGDIILEAESEKHAQNITRHRESHIKEEMAIKDSIAIQKKLNEHLEKYHAERQERLLRGRYRKGRAMSAREKEISVDLTPFLAIILKGDVHGSVEAIIDVLSTYKYHDDCRLDLVHYGVGDVTDNDMFLAESYEGVIYCFSVNVPIHLRDAAEEKGIDIKHFNVIYHLIDDIKKELNSRLPMTDQEEILGEANVLQEFVIKDGKKKIHIAGCKCMNGIIKKNSNCKVIRNKNVLYEGPITSLKHEKTDVESIKTNIECGLSIENSEFAFLPGDTIVCYVSKFVPQTTKWEPGF